MRRSRQKIHVLITNLQRRLTTRNHSELSTREPSQDNQVQEPTGKQRTARQWSKKPRKLGSGDCR